MVSVGLYVPLKARPGKEAEVEALFARTQSLIGTIEALQGEGRSLRLIEFEEPGPAEPTDIELLKEIRDLLAAGKSL